MADPVRVLVEESAGWVKVASDVTAAMVHKQTIAARTYFATYVDKDGTPAADIDVRWALNSLSFASNVASDIYVKIKGGDGYVRVEV